MKIASNASLEKLLRDLAPEQGVRINGVTVRRLADEDFVNADLLLSCRPRYAVANEEPMLLLTAIDALARHLRLKPLVGLAPVEAA